MTSKTLFLIRVLMAPLLLSAPSHAALVLDNAFCFSGRATVSVYGKGNVPVSDLEVGDYVVTGNDKDRYEPVYAFGHYKRKAEPTEFLVIHTFPFDRKKRPLEITGQHMLYLHGKQNPVRADSLSVGDVLRGDHYTGLTVTKITKVKGREQYAPLTPHGTVLVDGILASSYISLQKDAREHIELGENGFTVRISQRVMVHMFLSPLRMYCMGISPEFCHSYNEEGLPPYVDFGLKLADWGNRQNVFIQLVGLLVFFLILVPSVLIEDLAGPELGPIMLGITIISLILYKRSNYRSTTTHKSALKDPINQLIQDLVCFFNDPCDDNNLTMVSFRRKKKDEKEPKPGKEDAKPAAEAKKPAAKEEKKASAPKSAPAKPPTLDDIPQLIETMLNSKGEKSAAATKRIYELCDVGHKQNRVPMVCSGKYDVLTPLAQCLTQESGDGRHLACLALNNLSIPTENKRVMALGPASEEVIGGLCKVIAEDKQESYLCCICLMNLSFLEASITTILQHSPSPDGKTQAPLENPSSLLRVLEKLLTNSPAVPKSGSGKSEGVRWACGLIKNLAKSEENAALIGQTDIPKCVVENIRSTTAPPSRWTSNSLEDFSLFVILNLAQWPVSRDALIQAGAVDVIKNIMSEGDLQGLKATMACAFLDAQWASFPDGGSPAAKSVSELMTNIVEKKGKDGQYAYGVFKLYTATKAFRDLCLAAKKADSEGDESNTKVLAVPSAVALNFQIISDLVLSAMDDAEGGSKYVPDAMSAEFAVGAIEAMLPSILTPAEPPRTSIQSEKACGEIAQMLITYSEVAGTSSEAKESARNASNKIKEASGSARPVLEISHDLWTQYRKREGQPMDQFISQEKGIEVNEQGPLDFLPCASNDGNCTIL